MTKLVPIEIDFDIYKLIEGERKGFDEPQYIALRRLLKLPEKQIVEVVEAVPMGEGRSWREGLVEVPHGALARMEYDRGRQVYEGKFLDGKIVVGGNSYESLSEAAKALAVSKKGASPSLNGWKYWSAKLPGEQKWRSLWDMRAEGSRKIAGGNFGI
jgi:hypothetical protein